MPAKERPVKRTRKWSAAVTKNSNALDLEKGAFTSGDPEKVASSLERSAAASRRRKGTAYQSAMPMLNFYINRAGKNLPASKKKILEKAKEILKEDHAKKDRAQTAHPKKTHPEKTHPKKTHPMKVK